ncbi:zinc ribbon domain-containing protein [Candidatus Bathyarchaeota archaeon]|nr:zinc ribbon domain-containing protein [Candidatus Bathyarchaeota archaeon]
MFESNYPMSFSGVYLQIATETSLIAAITMVIAVSLLSIVLMLAFRRPSLSGGLTHRDLLTSFHETYSPIGSSPTATALEMLRMDLEEAAAAYSAGYLNKEKFDERITDIKRSLEDLKHFSEATATTKNCVKCSAEIAKEAKYCDRCGAQQDLQRRVEAESVQ